MQNTVQDLCHFQQHAGCVFVVFCVVRCGMIQSSVKC